MAGIHHQQASQMDTGGGALRFGRSSVRLNAAGRRLRRLGFVLLCVVVGAACSGDGGVDLAEPTPSTIRSSGALAFADPDDPGPFAPQSGTAIAGNAGSDPVGDGLGDGPIPSAGPADPADESVDAPPDDVPLDPQAIEDTEDTDNPEGTDGTEDIGSLQPPVEREDGIELVFADGELASIARRSTIGEISLALGPLYIVTEEPFIRAGYSGGYSVSQGGEVLFWAVEENGRITTIMATNPRVGLDSGLRPTMPLVDAIALHGEPSLRLGPERREFATFADGTGAADGVQVLVAIGRFGGPVGSYVGPLEPGQETSGYQLADATIKELWFDLS